MPRTLMVGTADGLLEVSLGTPVPAVRAVSLDGAEGPVRSPLVVDHEEPERFYLATTTSGVLRSADRGTTWERCSEGITYKEVWALVQHPASGDLLAGSGPVAVARSADRGEHWETVASLMSAPYRTEWYCHVAPFHPRVRGIACTADDPGLLLAAVEEGWVLRSADAGSTWDNPREGLGQDVHAVALPAGSSGVVLVATGTGLYRSVDGGSTYEVVGGTPPYVTTFLTHPARPHTVLATAHENLPRHWREGGIGSGLEVIRSDDDGATWRSLRSGWPEHVHPGSHGAAALDPDDPDVVYVGLSDGSIWRSTDGERFDPMLAGLPHVSAITVLADGA